MLDWCIVTLASARLKASVWFPPLRRMYQKGGTCKGCDIYGSTIQVLALINLKVQFFGCSQKLMKSTFVHRYIFNVVVTSI